MLSTRELKFLSCLRENSREKLTCISRKTNIPISTLFDVLKELDEKVIIKSTILINFFGLGYHFHAQALLKVDLKDRVRLKTHLHCHPHVNNLYKVNGEWDFLVDTFYKNIQEFDFFLDNLEEKFVIEDKQVIYLVEEIKKEGFSLEPISECYAKK